MESNLLSLPPEVIRLAFSREFTSCIDRIVISRVCRALQAAVRGDISRKRKTCKKAAKYNYFDIVMWACSNGCRHDGRTVDRFAKAGNLDAVMWLTTHHPTVRLPITIIDSAFKSGNLEMIKWLTARGSMLQSHHYKIAIYRGYSDLVSFLMQNGVEYKKSAFVDFYSPAIDANDMDTINWLLANNFPPCSTSCAKAAANGDLDLFKKIVGSSNNASYSIEAAKHGHIHIIEYLVEMGWEISPGARTYALVNGDSAMMELLDDVNCGKSCTTMRHLAYYGMLDIMRAALAQGYPWDSQTAAEAAAAGHIDILEFLHDNGCPFDESVAENAACKGQLDTFIWLLEIGCPWDLEVVVTAAYNSSQDEILCYIVESGLASADEVDGIIEEYERQQTRFFHRYRCY